MKLIIAVTLFALADAAASFASTPQLTVVVGNPGAVHRTIKKAAEKVCWAAKAHDTFDDYGSMDECVADAIDTAQIRVLTESRISQATQSSR